MPKNEFLCDCNIVHPHLVEQAVKGMPSAPLLDELAQFYHIIGDATRCKIVFALKGRELCVCDLANVLSMSKSSVSHQLAKMLRYGVVKRRRAGKEAYYALDDTHVVQMMEIALCHVEHKCKEKQP
jgi:ArsR family transcriptional regulator